MQFFGHNTVRDAYGNGYPASVQIQGRQGPKNLPKCLKLVTKSRILNKKKSVPNSFFLKGWHIKSDDFSRNLWNVEKCTCPSKYNFTTLTIPFWICRRLYHYHCPQVPPLRSFLILRPTPQSSLLSQAINRRDRFPVTVALIRYTARARGIIMTGWKTGTYYHRRA